MPGAQSLSEPRQSNTARKQGTLDHVVGAISQINEVCKDYIDQPTESHIGGTSPVYPSV